MGDKTKIEWTDATLNYVNGCTVISPGCANCYAMRAGGRNLPNHPSHGLTMPSKAGHVWTGEVRANERALEQALGWQRPRRIFWNAHGDLFHSSVPDAWIDRQWEVMRETPQHTHMVLTKRPERMREYLAGDANPAPNIWLGTSVEDQTRADERIPHLLATPAAVRFLSCEPLLGPVSLGCMASVMEQHSGWSGTYDALGGSWWPAVGNYEEEYRNRQEGLPRIDWVIVGGESGRGARHLDPAWARSLRDQCAAAGTAFFMKQMSGEKKPLPPIPDDLRVQQWPAGN